MHSEKARTLWQRHGVELLDGWISERPGSRPEIWWQIDAPEPRRLILGRGVLLSERYRNLVAPSDRGVPMMYDEGDAVFETEGAYLERLDLLTQRERAMRS
jgi:hypothetical protein